MRSSDREGADLDRASRAIVYGALCNAGQSCVAVERVLAVPAVFDELLARVTALGLAMILGAAAVDTAELLSTVHSVTSARHHMSCEAAATD